MTPDLKAAFHVAGLMAEVERLQKELAAYQRAKSENDERFMCERDEARQEVERLQSQLPEGMKHCTIVAKQCEKGHGWLTATNWVQHGCPWCEVERLRAANAELLAGLQPFAEYAGIVSEFANGLNPIGDACPPAGLTEPGQWRNAKPLPTLGDCRKAADLLAKRQPAAEEGAK